MALQRQRCVQVRGGAEQQLDACGAVGEQRVQQQRAQQAAGGQGLGGLLVQREEGLRERGEDMVRKRSIKSYGDCSCS